MTCWRSLFQPTTTNSYPLILVLIKRIDRTYDGLCDDIIILNTALLN